MAIQGIPELYSILKTRGGQVKLVGSHDEGLMCLLLLCFGRYTLHQNILKFIKTK